MSSEPTVCAGSRRSQVFGLGCNSVSLANVGCYRVDSADVMAFRGFNALASASWPSIAASLLILCSCKSISPISSEFRTTAILAGHLAGPTPESFVVDTSYRYVDADSVSAAAEPNPAGTLLGWGRYLTNKEGGDPSHTVLKDLQVIELSFLGSARVPMIPLYMPPQRDLAGSEAMGLAAAHEAAGLVQIATAPRRTRSSVIVFLDIEPNWPVSSDYLLGWCRGLRDYKNTGLALLPAVYANGSAGGQPARRAVNAIRTQCEIQGLWYARYVASEALPHEWPDFNSSLKGQLEPVPGMPVYLWQYFLDKQRQMDLDLVNPGLANALLDLTIKSWDEPRSNVPSLAVPAVPVTTH